MPRAKKPVVTPAVDPTVEPVLASEPKYTDEQLVLIHQFAAALLSNIDVNMHQDAIVNRGRIAFRVAQELLVLAEEVAALEK